MLNTTWNTRWEAIQRDGKWGSSGLLVFKDYAERIDRQKSTVTCSIMGVIAVFREFNCCVLGV
jgi:hypothetical protein